MTITIPDRIRIAAPPEVTEWGFRVVARDRSTRHGYRWAAPGEWATAPGPINDANRGACPTGVGDGICVARTWRGVYVQGYRCDRIMLVGWSPVDVLGDETDKVRLRREYRHSVVASVTPPPERPFLRHPVRPRRRVEAPPPSHVRGRDGVNDVYGYRCFSTDHDSTWSYPVLDDICPGPRVGAAATRSCVTGARGTCGRSRSWA